MRDLIDTPEWEAGRESYEIANPDARWDALPFSEQLSWARGVAVTEEAPPPSGTDTANGRSVIWNLATGLHLNIPAEVYHHRELGGPVNCSALSEVAKSLSKYLAWCKGERSKADSKALHFGRAWHCHALEPYVFAKTYAFRPDFGDCRFKENKARRDAWEAEHANHIVLDRAELDTIVRMTRALMSDDIARELLSGGVAEATVRWDDEETGLPCKLRADYYREDLATVVDLKSTVDASESAFGKSAASYRYHVQAAHYSAGFAAIGKPLDSFLFIAVEKEPPYDMSIYYIDREGMQKGEERYRENMRTLAGALETGEFPGYPKGIRSLALPYWTA